jgi:hypothetical protein
VGPPPWCPGVTVAPLTRAGQTEAGRHPAQTAGSGHAKSARIRELRLHRNRFAPTPPGPSRRASCGPRSLCPCGRRGHCPQARVRGGEGVSSAPDSTDAPTRRRTGARPVRRRRCAGRSRQYRPDHSSGTLISAAARRSALAHGRGLQRTGGCAATGRARVPAAAVPVRRRASWRGPGGRSGAAGTGRRRRRGRFRGLGRRAGLVVLVHPDGISTEYEPVHPAVRRGQRVRRGQVIGHVHGRHGACAPGSCLHWGARRGGHYIDPLALLRPLGPVRLLPWK